MKLNTDKLKDIQKDSRQFLKWSRKNPIGSIPKGVSKEGAGENRIPFAHLANSVPVYLVFKRLLETHVKSKASVIDVGCGTGRNISFISEMVKKPGYEYFGIDYSTSCIQYAEKQYAKQGVRYAVYQGSTIPYPTSAFDFVVSSHVLEHIPQTQILNFVEEITRILKSGGIAIIGTPNRKYCQDLFRRNPSEEKKFRLIIPHLHEVYMNEIKNIMRKVHVSEYTILQTSNMINRKLMQDAISKIRPTDGIVGQIKYEVYNTLRQNSTIQALMARIGTELILKNMKYSYSDLVDATDVYESNKDDGDNFIIVLRK